MQHAAYYKRCSRGFALLEYSLFIVMAIFAFIALQPRLHRAVQGRVRQDVDMMNDFTAVDRKGMFHGLDSREAKDGFFTLRDPATPVRNETIYTSHFVSTTEMQQGVVLTAQYSRQSNMTSHSQAEGLSADTERIEF